MTEEEKKQKKEEEAFSSPWEQVAKSLYEELSSREPFSYDAASDPLYRQYRAQYTREGARAMQDTVGRAAALTGGYGNSYAVTAGAAAYERSLDQLGDVIPELYELARKRYENEGDALLARAEYASEQYDKDYERYRTQKEQELREKEAEREEQEKEAARNEKLEAGSLWPEDIRAQDVQVATGEWIGVERDQGVAVMLKAGVPAKTVRALLTPEEWTTARRAWLFGGKGDAAVADFTAYEYYLSDYVTRALASVKGGGA
jgi:hypothetical protein